jgi:hypothetical protein
VICRGYSDPISFIEHIEDLVEEKRERRIEGGGRYTNLKRQPNKLVSKLIET